MLYFVIQTIGSKIQSCATPGISILQKNEIFQHFSFVNYINQLKYLKTRFGKSESVDFFGCAYGCAYGRLWQQQRGRTRPLPVD